MTKEEQDQIKEIKKRMSDLSIDFNNYINEENTVLEFTMEELSKLNRNYIRIKFSLLAKYIHKSMQNTVLNKYMRKVYAYDKIYHPNRQL